MKAVVQFVHYLLMTRPIGFSVICVIGVCKVNVYISQQKNNGTDTTWKMKHSVVLFANDFSVDTKGVSYYHNNHSRFTVIC